MVEDKQSVLLRNDLIAGEDELHAEDQLEQGTASKLRRRITILLNAGSTKNLQATSGWAK